MRTIKIEIHGFSALCEMHKATARTRCLWSLVSGVFYCTTSLLLILLFTIRDYKKIPNWFLMYNQEAWFDKRFVWEFRDSRVFSIPFTSVSRKMLCVWSESVIFQRCFIVCFFLLHSFCQCIWGSITQLLGRGLSIWIKYFYQKNKTDTVACSFEMFVKPYFASRFHLCNEQQLCLRRIFLGKTLYRCERWLKKILSDFPSRDDSEAKT